MAPRFPGAGSAASNAERRVIRCADRLSRGVASALAGAKMPRDKQVSFDFELSSSPNTTRCELVWQVA